MSSKMVPRNRAAPPRPRPIILSSPSSSSGCPRNRRPTYDLPANRLEVVPRNFEVFDRNMFEITSNATDIFIYGGRRNDGVNTSDLWCTNKATKRCRHLASRLLPHHGRSGSTMGMWDKQLVISCHYLEFGLVQQRVFLVNPYAQSKPTVCELDCTGEAPDSDRRQAIAMFGDHMYVATEAGFHCELYRLNLRTSHWERLRRHALSEAVPVYRTAQNIFADEHSIYLLNGDVTPLMSVWVFDLAGRHWRQLDTLPDDSQQPAIGPSQRVDYACVQQMNGQDIEVIVAGGWKDMCPRQDFWLLNLRTLRWRQMIGARLPEPMFKPLATTDGGGSMYILGGMSGLVTAAEPLHVWTRVPTLTQLCLARMLAAKPHLLRNEARTLLEAGVPCQLVPTAPISTDSTHSRIHPTFTDTTIDADFPDRYI